MRHRGPFTSALLAAAAVAGLGAGCARGGAGRSAPESLVADTAAIRALATELASDAYRGRGPWTPENERVARLLASRLARIGARPVTGASLLIPFTAPARPADTVYNVVGVLPSRDGSPTGDLVGITAHFDHLGVRAPDASGDSVHNGFLDAALPVAMVLDVARRYASAPGTQPLVVMLFNLEEQGLLGARAFAAHDSLQHLVERLRAVIGVDAGSPAGEAVEWQLMGAVPPNDASRVADSLARQRGWTTTATPPRPISDVFVFAQRGIPILFPIPGRVWRGYSDAQRAEAMARFDHYHQPADEPDASFPMTGTAHFADWLWSIVNALSREGIGRR
jgi:Zn-dependent M28 family amino/carboxypeptidase